MFEVGRMWTERCILEGHLTCAIDPKRTKPIKLAGCCANVIKKIIVFLQTAQTKSSILQKEQNTIHALSIRCVAFILPPENNTTSSIMAMVGKENCHKLYHTFISILPVSRSAWSNPSQNVWHIDRTQGQNKPHTADRLHRLKCIGCCCRFAIVQSTCIEWLRAGCRKKKQNQQQQQQLSKWNDFSILP